MPTISTPTTAVENQDEQIGQRFSFVSGPGETSEPPETPQLQIPRIRSRPSRPERDTERRELMALVQGLGFLGTTAGAASDADLLTQVGAGLSQGAGRARGQAEKKYQTRLKGYRDFLADARQYNRQAAMKEAQADYEAALTDYRLDREAQQAEAERKFERELNEPTDLEKKLTQQELETAEAREEATRALAQQRRRPEQPTGPFTDLPDDPQQLQQQDRLLQQQIRSMRRRLQQVDTGPFGDQGQVRRRQIGDRIDDLILQREAVRAKLDQMEGQQAQGQQGEGRRSEQGDEARPRAENLPSVFNQGGTTRPGPAARPQQGGDETQRPRDVSDQIPSQLRQRIRSQLPEDVPLREALNAAALVRSDTTDFTPSRFQQAYGFNPFQ